MISGHEQKISRLNKMLARNSVPQAMLFVGPEHVGKHLIAVSFAHTLVQGAGEFFQGEHEVFNPDVIHCAPESETKKDVTTKKDISVSQIREALRGLALHPYAGSKKVLVIDDADRMTRGAQNALLKTLEEPTASSHIILVAHNEEALLSTIFSRVVIVRFGLVADEEIAALGVDGRIVQQSNGRPGIAENFKNNKENFESFHENIENLTRLSEKTIAERFALAEQYAKNKSALRSLLSAWVGILRKQSQHDGDYTRYSQIERIMQTRNLLATTNTNTRLALENLFLSF